MVGWTPAAHAISGDIEHIQVIGQRIPRFGWSLAGIYWQADARNYANLRGGIAPNSWLNDKYDPEETAKDECGNPVRVASGAKVEHVQDFQGAGEWPLRITRHYNSLRDEGGVFGPQWWSLFDQRLVLNSYGKPDYVLDEFGEKITFEKDASSTSPLTYTSPLGANRIQWQPGQVWLLHKADGTRLRFDTNGQLFTWHKHALKLTFHYQNERLVTVTDSAGRRLALDWGSQHITAITDPAGNRYQYRYSNGLLTRVTYPDNLYHDYLYENTDHPHALTGISYNAERYGWYEYDQQGRAISSSHANGIDRFTFNYQATLLIKSLLLSL